MRIEKPKQRRTMPEPAPGLDVNFQELAQNPQAPNDTFGNTQRSRTVQTEQPRRFRLIPTAQAQTPPQQDMPLPEDFNLDSAINAEYGRLGKIGSDLNYENVHSFENDSTNAMNFVFEAERLGLDALAQQQKIRDARIRRGRNILTVNTPLSIGGILAAKQGAKAAGPYLYNLEEFIRRQPRTPHGVLTAADNIIYQNKLGIPFGKYRRFYRPGIPTGPLPERSIAKKAAKGGIAKKAAKEGMEGFARAGGRAISAGILATIPWDDVLAAVPTIASMAAYGELPSQVIAQKENEAYYNERDKAMAEGRLTADGRIIDPLPTISQGVERPNQGAINRFFKRNPGRVQQ